MKYLVFFCIWLIGCTDNHLFMGDTLKEDDCWYIHELVELNGAKVVKVGKQEILYNYIVNGVILDEFDHASISYFKHRFRFKRDCPK